MFDNKYLYFLLLIPGYLEDILYKCQVCGNMGLYGLILGIYYCRNMVWFSLLLFVFSLIIYTKYKLISIIFLISFFIKYIMSIKKYELLFNDNRIFI
jgi:hypothetical protein